MEYFNNIILNSIRKFVTFAGVGVVGTLFHYVTLIMFHGILNINFIIASTFGFCFGAIVNYVLNCRFTFKSRVLVLGTIAKFMGIAVIGVVLNAVIVTLVSNIFEVHYIVIQATATVIVLVFNFLANNSITFTEGINHG
jgi:putative flippase GtrA